MRRGADHGAVSVEFALGVGVLVLPVALLVLSLPTWVERRAAATSAAAEAARVAVIAPVEVAHEHAVAVVDETARNHGLPDGALALCLDVHDPGAQPSGCGFIAPPRGAAVTARVTYEVARIRIPLLGVDIGPISLAATHTEQVDQYRSRR